MSKFICMACSRYAMDDQEAKARKENLPEFKRNYSKPD